MAHKLVSTIILSGYYEECKCEIYQHSTEEGPNFTAVIFVLREVLMMLNDGPVSMRNSDAPNSRPVKTWVQAKIINDLKGSSLEEIEAEIEVIYHSEIHIITSSLDSPYGF